MNINSALEQASRIHSTIKNKIINKINENKNITLQELRDYIDLSIRENLQNEKNNGVAFPIGLNADSIVAHYTPTPIPKFSSNHNNPTFLSHRPICPQLNGYSPISKFIILKIDYGVHIDGYIIDSAFSINLDGTTLCTALINASDEAVNTVIKNIGVDMRLNELADIAHEIVNSYEYNNKPFKLVENVYSHNINRWIIHGNKFIKPDYKKVDPNNYDRIKDNEQYAIEFYPTNGSGKGRLVEDRRVYSHYSLVDRNRKIPLFQIDRLNKILNVVSSKFGSLPFCPNSILNYPIKINKTRLNSDDIMQSLQDIHDSSRVGFPPILHSYPPIIEINQDSLVSQTEKTILIENEKVITY